MKDETIWARSLAELPGVGYGPPTHIPEPSLKGQTIIPETHRYNFDGKEHVSLWWKTPEGGTSASPAARWFAQHESAETDKILEYLHQGLQCPGTPSDYHFAIQNAHEVLWKRRAEDPAAVHAVERVCLLDLALVEAYPEILQVEYDGEIRYAFIQAFERLIRLYDRSGDIEAALGIARRAQRFGQDRGEVERLKAKMNALRAEEVDESAR